MPTVGSAVPAKQTLVRPASFSLHSILCVKLRMCWLSPDRLASEVLHEQTTVKEAYDRELRKGGAHMSVRPWNI
jgi:hypothetical protein